MRVLLSASLVVAGAVVAQPALARDDHPVFITPGYIHSFVNGHSPASGNGAELSAMVGTATGATRAAEAVGVFTQLEALSGDQGRSSRWAFGAQASVLGLGLELGYALRSADSGHAKTEGIQFATFFSLGYFSIAYRWTAPVAGGRDSHRSDHGIVLAFKFPFAVRGRIADLIDVPPIFSGGPVTFGN